MSIPLLNTLDPVHLLLHTKTQSLFGIHKTFNASPPRSMTYVIAFTKMKDANLALFKMQTYKQQTGAWPNRILDNDKAYLWELHAEDEDTSTEDLEITTTTFGKMQTEMHKRNMGLELVHQFDMRPNFSLTATMASPRTDYNIYRDVIEKSYNLSSFHVTNTKELLYTDHML